MPVKKSLPYSFIPFAKEYEGIYDLGNLPKHNENKGLSGYIEYKIVPCSDLIIETRKKYDGGYFISGSKIRGKIRSNLEILGRCFPKFIGKDLLIFRDFAGRNKNSYLKRIEAEKGIEKSVRAGFLKNENGKYYIVPAAQIGDRYFLSIKEHRLVNMGLGSGKNSLLYNKWEENKFEMNEVQQKIDELTRKIKEYKDKNKEKLKNMFDQKQNMNFWRKFNLNVILKKEYNEQKLSDEEIINKRAETLKSDLLKKLHGNDELCKYYSERWKFKAQIHIKYKNMDKNEKFKPYECLVFLKRNSNNGIEKIAFDSNEKEGITEKAYLFNSSNASSKRSHYLVLQSNNNDDIYNVPESVINAYNQNFKKFRVAKNEEGRIEKGNEVLNNQYTIVFFTTKCNKEKNLEEVDAIGRTPFLKIESKNQIQDIIEQHIMEKGKNQDKYDYENALFGFTSEEKGFSKEEKGVSNYKSRLRFTAVDIKLEDEKKVIERSAEKDFILLSPLVSAYGMYLQQDGKEIVTYENDISKLKLNGYKYYKVRENLIEVKNHNDKENNSEIYSRKKIISEASIKYMEGKIYFKNLSDDELGLLILSLDIKKFKDYRADKHKIEDAFELIGEAKPYGYGKVKINMEKLHIIDRQKTDFESLIGKNEYIENDIDKYINAFINTNPNFNNYVKSYIESKFERKDHTDIEWNNFTRKGYEKNWILKLD